MSKTSEDAYALLEEMAANNYHWPSDRQVPPKKVAGMYDVDSISMLNAKLDCLMKKFGDGQVNALSNMANPSISCEMCAGFHVSSDCPLLEQANVISNFGRPHKTIHILAHTTLGGGIIPTFHGRINQ